MLRANGFSTKADRRIPSVEPADGGFRRWVASRIDDAPVLSCVGRMVAALAMALMRSRSLPTDLQQTGSR
jgi:hypothetical protein